MEDTRGEGKPEDDTIKEEEKARGGDEEATEAKYMVEGKGSRAKGREEVGRGSEDGNERKEEGSKGP